MRSPAYRTIALVATLVVALAAAGCAESSRQQATGKGRIRGVNAIPTSPEINFTIEERFLAGLNYKQASGFNSYDDLSYNFNFDFFPATALQPDRIATQFLDVVADTEYTIVATGSMSNASTLVWENPVREFDGSETIFEVMFAHAAPQLGDMDVYFAATGTVPALGQAVGALAFGERLPLTEFEEDASGYEIILTAKDDPATVMFQSAPLGPLAQTRILIGVFDPDPTLRGNVAVNLINQSGSSARIADINFPSQVRLLHGAFGTGNVDGYLAGDFSATAVADLAFLAASDFADSDIGTTQLTVTAAGNPGAILHEADINVPGAARTTIGLVGEPGALSYFALPDTARPVEVYPVIRILNASFNTDLVDIYLADPGTPIDDQLLGRFLGLPTLATTNFQAVDEGMHELTITLRGEKTPISAPIVIDVANGDRVDMIIVDTVDPAVVDLVVWEFRPAP